MANKFKKCENSCCLWYILSFVPFGRDIKVNLLDKFLDVFDSENLLPYFPGIGKNIADIINATMYYLPQNDIVQRY